MQFALSELVSDEALFVEICVGFNENVCVPIYRNGAEFGLQSRTTQILGNLKRLCEVHRSLHDALKSASNDDMNGVEDIFERYCDELERIDLDLMEGTCAQMEEIFELSYNTNIINMMRKFNFEHSFNDIGYYKEEPQFIAYVLYLNCRLHRYTQHYHISSLNALQPKCVQLYHEIECALYLLCLQTQIAQCPFQLFMKKRGLIRLEKLNMEAGKFKKKQKKRLLILLNDRIVWCSLLQHSTKKGAKYKYKGSYRIKDDNFEIKPFYYDSNDENHESISHDAYDNESMSLHLGLTPVLNQHFGFKFGIRGNEKSFKVIVCSESQQQFWCKDINKYIIADSAIATNKNNNINFQSIDLFERFLKHSTSWNSDKIWRKMFDTKTCDNQSLILLRIILSLFYDLVPVAANNTAAVQPPPVPKVQVPIATVGDAGADGDANDDSDLSTSFSETPIELSETVSNQSISHRSSLNDTCMNDANENKRLKQEMEHLQREFNKLQNKYKIIQNENAKLSARNAFLNHRVSVFSEMFSANHHMQRRRRMYSDDDEEEEEAEDEDDDAAKYMKMISHKRKNSDSTLFNKSPSFLSTVKDELSTQYDLDINKEKLYLNKKETHSSKSRDEIVYRRKKKPKKKAKYRKTRKPKLTHHAKITKASQDDSTPSNPSDYY